MNHYVVDLTCSNNFMYNFLTCTATSDFDGIMRQKNMSFISLNLVAFANMPATLLYFIPQAIGC